MRFDNYRNRPARREQHRLAAISDIWQNSNNNLRRYYIPDASLVVDEQLAGFRRKIPGRTYMPNKLRKYGIKFYWLCESPSGCALNGFIYTGRRPGEAPHRNLARDIVLKFTEPYFRTGRDIFMDRFFTSHQLACDLLEQNLTLVRTLSSHRREVPQRMKSVRGREVESTRFIYDNDKKIIVLSYVPKRMSSSHSSSAITDDHRKPQIIIDYNTYNGGLDTLAQNTEGYSFLRKTNRWPMVINYNLLTVAVCNAI